MDVTLWTIASAGDMGEVHTKCSEKAGHHQDAPGSLVPKPFVSASSGLQRSLW